MAKMVSNILGMALALSIGIMLVSTGSASSVLGAISTGAGNMSKAGGATAGNMSKAGGATAGNMSKAGGATAGNMSIAGGTAAGNVTKAASNATKVGGGVLTNLSNVVGCGFKLDCHLILSGKTCPTLLAI